MKSMLSLKVEKRRASACSGARRQHFGKDAEGSGSVAELHLEVLVNLVELGLETGPHGDVLLLGKGAGRNLGGRTAV
jgi:hypothetical protein